MVSLINELDHQIQNVVTTHAILLYKQLNTTRDNVSTHVSFKQKENAKGFSSWLSMNEMLREIILTLNIYQVMIDTIKPVM